MVDFNSMINIALIVIGVFIAITLLANFETVTDCTSITNTTLNDACNDAFNNAGTLYSLAAVLILLLVVPLIRGVLTRGGGV
jgi:ACR3 family arsenite efflux pump ArsB